MLQSSLLSCSLLLGGLASLVGGRAVSTNATVYELWSRDPHPLPSFPRPPTGMELPFRRNGTWIDVGIWFQREEILALPPFRFTLGPGRHKESYTITDVDSGKNLAFTSGSVTVPVNYAVLAAFILTDEGNIEDQVINDWTITIDDKGRKLLGLANSANDSFFIGTDYHWTAGNCAWIGRGMCDGMYFLPCGGCFGQEAFIELVEAK